MAATNAVPLTFIASQTMAPRVVEETFVNDLQLDRGRSSGRRFGDLGLVGGTGLHGDFDHRLGADLGNGVFEFDLQRDTRGTVRGFAIPATRTLSGREEFVTDGTFQFASFRVPAGVTVRVVGSTPARIMVRGQVLIDGVLDVSGAFMPHIPTASIALGQAGGRGGCGNYLTLSVQFPSGGGGGGMFGAGGQRLALQTPTGMEMGPPTPGGATFQLFPLPSPTPPSFAHFLAGGAGGGGGASNIYAQGRGPRPRRCRRLLSSRESEQPDRERQSAGDPGQHECAARS